MLLDGERIDDLQCMLSDGTELKIIQNPNWFCFGIDAVLLSDFAQIRKNDIVMDLGTGTGIIPLLLSAKTSARRIDGLEIQKEVADMAKRSVILNKLDGRVNIINDNLVGYNTDIEYDVVICNPPYKVANTGIKNSNDKHMISRHEVCCNLLDVISTASRLLKPLGKLFMIHRPERIVDIMCCMRENKIEPKRLRYVHSYCNKSPVMLLVEGRKHSGTYIKTEPPLIIYNNDGSYTDEVNKIYGV